jgi:hypothetical protein
VKTELLQNVDLPFPGTEAAQTTKISFRKNKNISGVSSNWKDPTYHLINLGLSKLVHLLLLVTPNIT